MKTKVMFAALMLPVLVAVSACAGLNAKEEPLCAICARLAKETPPHSEKIAGRIYDPSLRCHRQWRSTASGKGAQTMECVCQ